MNFVLTGTKRFVHCRVQSENFHRRENATTGKTHFHSLFERSWELFRLQSFLVQLMDNFKGIFSIFTLLKFPENSQKNHFIAQLCSIIHFDRKETALDAEKLSRIE